MNRATEQAVNMIGNMPFYPELIKRIEDFEQVLRKQSDRWGYNIELDERMGDIYIRYIHRYDVIEVRGGDHYMDIWEMVDKTVQDHIEVLEAIYEPTEDPMPGIVKLMNTIYNKPII